MTGFVLALVVVATSAAAQAPTTIHGLPIASHRPTPPPVPISRLRPQALNSIRQPGRITYLPSYLYTPYVQPMMPPQTNVSVNVTTYAPPAEVVYFAPIGPQYLGGGYVAGELWNPQADARQADNASARAAPSERRAPLTRRLGEPADVNSLDAVVNAMYDIISGPPIKGRDWERFRSLFADGAHLIATVTLPGLPARAAVMTTDEYVATAAPLLQRGVFEKEISRTVEQFGRMAQVFSTYESRYRATDEKPFQRGINSIQLLNDGTRWWILSVYWDAERPDNPIPPKYLTPRR